MRVSTPSLTFLLEASRNPTLGTVAIERHKRLHNNNTPTYACYINDMFRLWGDKFIYDYKTLSYVLKKCGFSQILSMSFGVSNYKHLPGLERHADCDLLRKHLPLIIECSKK